MKCVNLLTFAGWGLLSWEMLVDLQNPCEKVGAVVFTAGLRLERQKQEGIPEACLSARLTT